MSAAVIKKMVLRATLAAVAALGVAVPVASATDYVFADHVGPVYYGYPYDSSSPYLGNVQAISGQSTGTAYALAYVNRGGVRESALATCGSPGCIAFAAWGGPYPYGAGSVGNYGNANPSYFNGVISG